MALPEESRRPSVLGHAILQLLTRNSASGYDLKKRFFSSVGHGWHAYDTQIYRELKSLEGAGYVTGKVAKGRSGPQRRIYSITDTGRSSLREWLTSDLDVAKHKDEFNLRVWTADLFPEHTFEELLESSKAQWQASLDHQRLSLQVLIDEYGAPDGGAPAEVYGRQLAIDATIAVTEAKLAWVERTLRVIRNRKAGS
ncbi:PadR family transcriptional regulator [Arthrobacter sp. zg-Y1219]|uniref:PadR family transcriptional regulator n=1 Tax=Arthrobacter sp. zg-Y1219 TaxID=3049067 RepID=UPI0024C4456B|nr:PadR family transcriptional regulator [Arthrobacter sp. zg-Y1219]MDK1361676.1 PadR family transcriptional regulator [Arthrobacter sp. zg-Y1219]